MFNYSLIIFQLFLDIVLISHSVFVILICFSELDASTTENETSEYETSEYADHNKDNLTDEDLGSGIDKDENKDKDKDADLGSGSDEDKDEDLGSSSSETENKDKDEHLEDGEVKGDDNYAALPIDGDVIGDDYAALPEDGEVMGEDYAAIVQPFDHAPPPGNKLGILYK